MAFSVDFDMMAGIAFAAAAIVYVVRLEGRINTLQAILERVEKYIRPYPGE